jgi:hypothetical protein
VQFSRYVSQGPRSVWLAIRIVCWVRLTEARCLQAGSALIGQTFDRCSTAAVPPRWHAYTPLCRRTRLASLLSWIPPARQLFNAHPFRSTIPSPSFHPFSPQWRQKGDFLTSEASSLEPRVHPSNLLNRIRISLRLLDKTPLPSLITLQYISRVIAVDRASPRPSLLSGRLPLRLTGRRLKGFLVILMLGNPETPHF